MGSTCVGIIEARSIGCVLIGPVVDLFLGIVDNACLPDSFKGKQINPPAGTWGLFSPRPDRAGHPRKSRRAAPAASRATGAGYCGLLQRGVDRGELRIEVGAEAVDRGNNRNRNAGRDQAVFDGGGSRFVIQETRKKLGHVKPLLKRRLDHGSPELRSG